MVACAGSPTAACAGRGGAARPAAGSWAPPARRDAPAPIRATRLPARSSSWSQRAVWKALPSKRSMPGSAGSPRLAQEPGRGHEHARGERAARGLELPALLARRPRWPRAARSRGACAAGPEALGAVAQVGQELVAHRIGARPVRVGRERERVEVRGDVALAARDSCSPTRCRPRRSSRSITTKSSMPSLLQPDRHARARRSRRRRWRPRARAVPSTRVQAIRAVSVRA